MEPCLAEYDTVSRTKVLLLAVPTWKCFSGIYAAEYIVIKEFVMYTF